MSVQSIGNSYSSVYSLDEILQGTPETATEELLDNEKTYQNYKEELNEELKTTDRVWLEFHAGLCRHFGETAKSILYRVVKSSVNHPENSIAAANAITILKIMKISFSCLDLRGVQIPGADLSSSILDGADLSSANLENVNLENASLNSTNMINTNLKAVNFDVPNIFTHEGTVVSFITSPDNKYLVSEDTQYLYFWHLPSKTCIKKIVRPDNFYRNFTNTMSFTPDGQFLFIYDCNYCVDIWSVGDFMHVKKLKISDERQVSIELYFSPNGAYLITSDSESFTKTHLKLWSIQKTENNLLDINLKNEIILPYLISDIHFSKKLSIFYCLKAEFDELDLLRESLSICNVEELARVENLLNIDELNNFFVDVVSLGENNTYQHLDHYSLAISDISKNNEELLFIAVDDTIYSINILKKNKQKCSLEATQVTKIITDVADISSIHIFERTHELIYLCGDAVCLYSIRNNQCIGKFRLTDAVLSNLIFSIAHTNIYVGNCLNRVFMYSVDSLKHKKYISYEIDNAIACFSPDIRSVISVSHNFWMTRYDIETGTILKINLLGKIKSHVSDNSIINENLNLFSINSRYILIFIPSFSGVRAIGVINTANEEQYLKKFEEDLDNGGISVLSSNSEYFAFEFLESAFFVYKTIPSLSYIGTLDFKMREFSLIAIAISTDFQNNPKVALVDNPNKVILCNFIFKDEDEDFELVSEKKMILDTRKVLQILFTENDTKLIIACSDKVVIWDIEYNFQEEHKIKASCVDISRDGSLLIYYHWSMYSTNISDHQLCLYSITEKKILITQSFSLTITKLQISPDNRYILATTVNGSMYIWKILENSFRLLWRTSHNLQAQGLILGSNNLEKDVEEDLITKMDAIKL